mmetsp:Transcript_2510/g.7363  ORF Transcript_2510/g.7363 Transcript_2510/m.7363 type:complete len:127 (-) Transcript_2510:26-406(-)
MSQLSSSSNTPAAAPLDGGLDRLTSSSEDERALCGLLDSSSSGGQSLRRCKTSLDMGLHELHPPEDDGRATPRLTSHALRKHDAAVAGPPLDVSAFLKARDRSGWTPLPRVPENRACSFFWFLDRR